MIAKKVKMMPL